MFFSSIPHFQILRIARIKTKSDAFEASRGVLINRLIKQGDEPKEIKKTLVKMLGPYFLPFHMFCNTEMFFINFGMH